MAITGRCMCGDIKFEIRRAPEFMGVCHCRRCQRQSGSAFSTMAGVPADDFTLLRGQPRFYGGATQSGNSAEIAFCERCGSPIYTLLADQTDTLYLKTGTLDDTSWFEPQFHVWCADKQNWVKLDGSADGAVHSTGS